MHEYATVSSSSYDPASLAAKLTEKSAEGWHVVAIVPTGGDVTAFLSRKAHDSNGGSDQDASMPAAGAPDATIVAAEPTAEPTAEPAPEPTPTPEPAPAPEPVSEPAGWAVAPAAEPATPVAATPQPVAEVAPPAPAPAAPAVPAGWYADPAGRFELRYWDGGTWTEHVSRAGQQFTDPPVA